jgi:flagellar basal body-associated protein FliL
MSEPTPEAAPPADAAAAAPKASKLPIILAAVNFVAILGLGGYFVYTQQHAAAQAAKKSDEHGDAKKEEGHGEEKAEGHGEEEAEEEPAEEGHGEAKEEGHGAKKEEGHGAKKGGHGEEAPSGEAPAGGPLLALESMVTNMSEPDTDRYLKVSMQLRLTSEPARAEVEAHLVPVRNQILLYLSSLTVADTSGGDNKRDIQKRVKRIANEAMPSSRITAVYFTEFVIQ